MTVDVRPIKYFPSLTGLRWLCATMVFFVHYNVFAPNSYLKFLASGGSLGVSIFFTLSGFLIANNYGNASIWHKKGYVKYWLKRLARIYPVFFAVSLTILIIKIFLFKQQLHFFDVISHFLMLNGFFEKSFGIIIGQSWSITVEETFYILAPLIFLTLKKLKLVYMSIFFLLFGYAIVYLAAMCGATDFMHTQDYMLYRTFFGRSFEFLIGVWGCYYYKKYPNFRSSGWITYSALILILVFMFLQGGVYRDYFHHPLLYWIIRLRNFTFPILGIAIILGLITEVTILQKILQSSIFQLLGRCSYAFYLIHISAIIELIAHFTTDNFLFIYFISFVLSLLLYTFCEKPAQNAINRTIEIHSW